MKKFPFFLALVLPLVFLLGCSEPDPIQEVQDELETVKAAKGIDLNGPHFELNLLGKKDGWNDKEVDNPERHTMFVPLNTEGWNIELKTPNNLGEETLPGVRINMTQGTEFAVLDGTLFDGDPIDFQLGPGKYAVYVAMRGKKNVPSPKIDGWLEAFDDLGQLWYYQNLGSVTVTRKWTNATDLFMINETEAGSLPFDVSKGTEQWIFDYMSWLDALTEWEGDPVSYSQLAYFWQLQNFGSQLIKVRFYPI
jgi:hypothetical protein